MLTHTLVDAFDHRGEHCHAPSEIMLAIFVERIPRRILLACEAVGDVVSIDRNDRSWTSASSGRHRSDRDSCMPLESFLAQHIPAAPIRFRRTCRLVPPEPAPESAATNGRETETTACRSAVPV